MLLPTLRLNPTGPLSSLLGIAHYANAYPHRKHAVTILFVQYPQLPVDLRMALFQPVWLVLLAWRDRVFRGHHVYILFGATKSARKGNCRIDTPFDEEIVYCTFLRTPETLRPWTVMRWTDSRTRLTALAHSTLTLVSCGHLAVCSLID